MDTTTSYTPSDPISFHGPITFVQGIFARLFSFGVLNFLYVFLTLLAIGLITLILFLFVRMREIDQEDARNKAAAERSAASLAAVSNAAMSDKENKTWRHIREQLLGDSQSDWKLAIIEADIYLDRLLDDKGFHGDTTSDKLKQVTADKLPSLNMAREVHFIRNRIAHDGVAFVLTQPEARRLLSYYEMIFSDLGAI